LSLSRIAAAPILYLLVVRPGRYGYFAALLLFAAASFTDTLDGRIARGRGLVSPLGVFLDTTADKILVAVLLVGLAVVGLVPGWMAAVIIAREFLVTGLRSYAAALGVVIPAGGWGKAKTVITIAALLLVILAGDVSRGGLLSGVSMLRRLLLTSVGPFTLPVWSMLIAVIWTIGSGVEYVREAMPILGRGVSPRPAAEIKDLTSE
jgi:CDP-diacylglycerol--glycerol-3-phosphate 3-phosphatidyltransferase